MFAAVFVAAVAIAIPSLLWSTCTGTSPLREATQAFFERIRGGQEREAYDGLAAARHEQLSFESFTAELERPVFRGHEAVEVEGTQSHDDSWGCTRGELEMGGRDWSFEIYLVKEGQQWRVHTWIVDEPASFTRLHKLDRCQQW